MIPDTPQQEWVECTVKDGHKQLGYWRRHPRSQRIICVKCHPPATRELTTVKRLDAIARAAGARR
jgi:hypothetical protein